MKNRDNEQKKVGRKEFYTTEDIQHKLGFLHRNVLVMLIRTGQPDLTKVGRQPQEHYDQFVEENTFTPEYI